MIGTSEEVEVNKEARVVEEITVGKRTEERAEAVQDTVRRSKVEVEKIGPVVAPVQADTSAGCWARLNSRGERMRSPECGWMSL
jgi:hypothetical protein